MSEEYSDTSGEYGPGARCPYCHNNFHDEETGPNCEIKLLRDQALAQINRLREALLLTKKYLDASFVKKIAEHELRNAVNAALEDS